MKTRKYTLNRRAERQKATRRRIVEAAVRLHETLGPRATTVSAIAEEAGVQRLTVYRHFPDAESLFWACTAHWLADHPPPDAGRWNSFEDPGDRTRAALEFLYDYYRRGEEMWTRAYRDLESVPALRAPMGQVEDYLNGIRDDLLRSWSPPPAVRSRISAGLGHALRFETWRSLAGEGESDAVLAGMMTLWIRALSGERAAVP